VDWNDGRSNLPIIINEESGYRLRFTQLNQPFVLVLQCGYLKTRRKRVECHRGEALAEPLNESVQSTSSKHRETLNVAQAGVGTSVQDAEVGYRPLVVVR
jgi:hypothetical protein